MYLTHITIKSEIKEDAGREGARQLGVSTSEVIVEPAGESSYRVSLKHVPGLIEVDVLENNMSAVIRL